MSLKITFTDTKTGKVIAEDELTDEQVKALNTELENADVINPVTGKKTTGVAGWVLNILHQKARQKVDEIVKLTGEGSEYTPVHKKLEIIRKAEKERPELLKGAKQRQAEMLAKEKAQ